MGGGFAVFALVHRGAAAEDEGIRGDFRHERAVHEVPQSVAGGDFADGHGVQVPFGKDLLDHRFPALAHHDEHPLLRFTQQNFKRFHPGLAQRHPVEVDVHRHAAARRHLRRRAGDARSAHVLHAHDGIGRGQLQRGLEQQLLRERIADLHARQVVRALCRHVLRGKRCALDAVLARGTAHDVHRVARTARFRRNDVVRLHDADRHGVDERIRLVAGVEIHLSPDHGDAEAVAVIADALHHAGQQPARAVLREVAEPEAVELGNGAGAHREDVAVDAPDAGGRTLVGLDGRGVVVRFDLECAAEPVPDGDDACVLLPRLHEHALPVARQGFQPRDGVLVRAVLAPHHRVDAHLGEVRGAAQQGGNAVEFLRKQAHFAGSVQRGRSGRSGHVAKVARDQVDGWLRMSTPGRG